MKEQDKAWDGLCESCVNKVINKIKEYTKEEREDYAAQREKEAIERVFRIIKERTLLNPFDSGDFNWNSALLSTERSIKKEFNL